MDPTTQPRWSAGTRVEFADPLRGYRFAEELRQSRGFKDVRVWHDDATVVVVPSNAGSNDAGRALLQSPPGGIVSNRAGASPGPGVRSRTRPVV